MTDFILRVDSFHLTEEQTKEISAAIQGAAVKELAKLDMHAGKKTAASAAPEAAKATGGGSLMFFPALWNGGWLLRDFGQLPKIQNVIANVQTTQG